MPSYISSNANRLYSANETEYGRVPEIGARNRIPALRLSAKQQLDRAERRDKTGSRTFAGTPLGTRRRTTFELRAYMTSWANQQEEPAYGPLFRASLGSSPI